MATPNEASPLLAKHANSPVDSNGISDHDSEHMGNDEALLNGPSQRRVDEESQEEEASRETQYEGLPEVKKQLKFILPAVSIGLFLAAADQTIVASAYGKIGSDLNALNKTSWISTAYFLTSTSFQALYGKLSDIFGRKSTLLFAYTIFAFGSLFCGLARNIDELVAARAFAGIGGGGMTTVVSIMLSDIVPLRERGVWQGILNIVFALGAGCGAPLGGIFADSVGWRWAFLAQAPLCAVTFVAVALTLKLPKVESSDWKSKLKRVDFVGAIVLICAVFTLLLGLDRGSNVAWNAPITLISLCLSLPLFISFVLVEQKFAAEPFAPGRIIFEKSLVACYLVNFFSFGGMMSVIFYLPLFFQAVDGQTATQAGVRLIPSITAGVCGSLFGGILMQRTGKYYWLTVSAYTGVAIGILLVLLFTGLTVNTTYGILTGLSISSFANGIGVTTSLVSLIANAAPKDQAITTACSYLFRSLGSVVGLSLSATVVQQSLRTQLRRRLSHDEDADQIIQKVRESLEYIKTLKPETRKAVRVCYEIATRNGFGFMLGVVSLAMLSSWFIREKKLSR
ncbi:hypothetical protein MMC07_002928 [Pseudocyphellaria aurata]|nr:hypothetical protein [Pseudocyphellaria aurata]